MSDTAEIPLLDVRDLTVEFATRRGPVQAVRHVDLSVGKGETLGIVGESGSGKSVTSYAVMRILDRAGHIAQGSMMFSGHRSAQRASESEMRDLRGREMSMIFQNPRAALNPIRKVGHQIEDVLLQHAQADAARTRMTRQSRRCSRCASHGRRNAITPIRSSCRAGCASASSSPWRSPASRNC